MDFILGELANFVINTIDSWGYAGIFLLMALEGSFVPIPSEIILPFSGFLVFEGRFSLFAVALTGALGNIAGTLFTYSIARYLGLPFLHKYGKYFLVSGKDIDAARRLFEKYGTMILFASRLLPGVRGYVPIPAGVARMNIVKFTIYVFAGSLIWSYVLTYVGVIAGENWDILLAYFRKFDWALAALAAAGIVLWVWRHIKNTKHETSNK